MGVAAQHALDGCGGVEARGHRAAERLDALDCFGGSAGDDDVDGCGQLLGVLSRVY